MQQTITNLKTVEVKTECSVWMEMGYDTLEKLIAMSWEESCQIIMDYCKKHNFHYYAKLKEDFCVIEAAQEAMNLGKAGVVVDNLS